MQLSFALQPGDRYRIIIGMDILKEYKIMIDLSQEAMRFKIKEEKVNLKLTPRKTIFKSKQIKDYFDYLRKGRTIRKAQANKLEEEES
jgi:hypothetical protein